MRGTYDGDTPEDLFDGCGEGFAGVVSLCCSKTDKLCASKRECCGDENIAEAFEAIVECSWIDPVLPSYVPAVLCATAVDDYAKNSNEVSLHSLSK